VENFHDRELIAQDPSSSLLIGFSTFGLLTFWIHQGQISRNGIPRAPAVYFCNFQNLAEGIVGISNQVSGEWMQMLQQYISTDGDHAE
jgi:hypothetical protein